MRPRFAASAATLGDGTPTMEGKGSIEGIPGIDIGKPDIGIPGTGPDPGIPTPAPMFVGIIPGDAKDL